MGDFEFCFMLMNLNIRTDVNTISFSVTAMPRKDTFWDGAHFFFCHSLSTLQYMNRHNKKMIVYLANIMDDNCFGQSDKLDYLFPDGQHKHYIFFLSLPGYVLTLRICDVD